MKRLILIIFLFLFFTPGASFSQTVKDLLVDPYIFDGKIVEIEAEAIGEPLKDKDGIWINVFSDDYNISVFSKNKDLSQKIKFWGDYKTTGDILRIKGRFYKNSAQKQTRMIDAQEIQVIKQGNSRKEKVSPVKMRTTNILLVICAALGIIYFIKSRYGKRT